MSADTGDTGITSGDGIGPGLCHRYKGRCRLPKPQSWDGALCALVSPTDSTGDPQLPDETLRSLVTCMPSRRR